jgi:predicted amidohydrolase
MKGPPCSHCRGFLVTPGQHLEVFTIRGMRIGLLICYEIRSGSLPCPWQRSPDDRRHRQLAGAEVNPNVMAPQEPRNHIYILGQIEAERKERSLSLETASFTAQRVFT